VDGAGDSVAIWALPFSLATLQPAGKAFPIVQHGSSPVVSSSGTLVYSDVPVIRFQLGWVDRSGKNLSTLGEFERQSNPTLSPDGHKLAVEVQEGDPDLWVYDVDRGTRSRLTSDRAAEVPGAWSASGDRITYASSRNGNVDIFSMPVNGNGDATLLAGAPDNENLPDWSPDQRFLMYQLNSADTKLDLVYRERRADGSMGEPAVFLKTPFNEGAPRFSPDGRFVAYVSDESGGAEVYVRDFPKGANRWQVSAHGGNSPRWGRDGKEIFYVEGRSLMSVSVTSRPALSLGMPVRLFEQRSVQTLQYDVAPDSKRFIILDRPANQAPLSVHVVHNWFEDFRGRAN
jgi:Tol biopolymer transport system component